MADKDKPTPLKDLRLVEQRLGGQIGQLDEKIERVAEDLRAEMQETRAELRSVVQETKAELRSEMREMKAETREMKVEMLEMKVEMRDMKRDLGSGITSVLEQLGQMVGVLDDKYSDLPGRVDRLEHRFDQHCRSHTAHQKG